MEYDAEQIWASVEYGTGDLRDCRFVKVGDANALQCPKCSTSMTHVIGYKYNCPQCEKTFKI